MSLKVIKRREKDTLLKVPVLDDEALDTDKFEDPEIIERVLHKPWTIKDWPQKGEAPITFFHFMPLQGEILDELDLMVVQSTNYSKGNEFAQLVTLKRLYAFELGVVKVTDLGDACEDYDLVQNPEKMEELKNLIPPVIRKAIGKHIIAASTEIDDTLGKF